jgi:hypothetical protein
LGVSSPAEAVKDAAANMIDSYLPLPMLVMK